MMPPDVVWMALPALLVVAVVTGAQVLGARRARRENDRIEAAYRVACEAARRDGRRPPFPPNVTRWE